MEYMFPTDWDRIYIPMILSLIKIKNITLVCRKLQKNILTRTKTISL